MSSIFLSPGVYLFEQDLSPLPSVAGALRIAFVGTAQKGPFNTPVLLTSAKQAIDTFGEPIPEAYMMYAILEYFQEGNQCYAVRVGVECEDGQDAELDAICVDQSGAKVEGWGRIPVFTGIDKGRIALRNITAEYPITFQAAALSTPEYSDADLSSTDGATNAAAVLTGTYTGSIFESYTLIITGEPNLSSAEAMAGATYEIVRSSDGEIVTSGILADPLHTDVSQVIAVEEGVSIQITVNSGRLDINDTFTWNATPDNRTFQFSVEGVAGASYQMPSATYTTNATFVAAINALVASEDYAAIEYTVDGDTIPQITTNLVGRWIQLLGSEAFATSVGVDQYKFDIPRSYLIGTDEEPFNINSGNNKLVMKVVGSTETLSVSFSVATGTNFTASQVAALFDPSGVISGNNVYDVITITGTDGNEHVVFIVTTDYMLYTLKMMADFTNLKTMKLAQTLGINAPYQLSYRGFFDSRVSLPAGSIADPAIPESCSDDPLSAACNADSDYYNSIVGWLVAPSAGTWVDQYTVSLDLYTGGLGSPSGRYQITIRDQSGVTISSIRDVTFDKTSDRYIGNVLNPGQALAGAAGNPFVNWEPRPDYLEFDVNAADYEVRQPSTFNGRVFAGTANGIPTDSAYSSLLDAAVIGNSANGTGIFAFQNSETYDINLLATPGFSSGSVIGQALQLCETRGDTIYLVDPPFGLRPSEVVDWHNGILTSSLSSAINSSYGALYGTWVKVFDQFNRIEIWIPPSGPVSSVFARTARTTELWFAPAGLNRGRLLTALDVEFNPTAGERDLMYGNENAVNAIVKFPNIGTVVYGNKTLQRADTLLNRISTRMLVSYLKKNSTQSLRQFLFEPIDEVLFAQVISVLDPLVGNVLAKRGVRGYKIICDNTNNTPDSIAQNILNVAILVAPSSPAEFIAVTVGIVRSDASFSIAEALIAGNFITGLAA